MITSIGIGIKTARRRTNRWNSLASIPSNLSLIAISSTQINGTFDINGTGQTGHKVYVSMDGVNYSLNQTLTGSDNTFSVTGLTAGATYYFKVVAYQGYFPSPACEATLGTVPADNILLNYDGTPILNFDGSYIYTN